MYAGTPYDVRLTSYNQVVFDFLQDPSDRELIILKSSQIGLTLAVFIGLAWTTKYNPGNLLYVAKDVLSVRELGKQRLTPIMCQVSPEFADEIGERDQTIQVKKINGVTMRLIGAQSASGFISFPCSIAALDETEVHGELDEGSTIALTRARFKGDSDYKMIVFSKAQDSPIYETDKITKRQKLVSGQGTRTCDEFYSGTQETLHVPCPHCDHFQPLEWDQMRLPPEAIISEPGVVPVELSSFTANVNGTDVNLTWSTATETNNNGFEVQRKSGEEFVTIGFVRGNGTTTEIQNYSYTDSKLPIGSYSYRLKQVDFDGSFEYSNVVNVDLTAPTVFALEQNYPNPFNPSTLISYSIPQNSFVTLKVYDIIGNEVATLVNQTQSAGKYDIRFDASNLSNGVYLYSIKTDNFSSTKKMILMK